ncbi:chromosomal replication initiator protein [Glycomyces harbinensis]|uniref:Chromosomal replication initiator protein DnaA n=1 Tax=Glycomyces harbinensis TaxID=58114 RepID=A0A1G6VVT4_9ACTN|nr:chromosomal replication initiator protein DnaA [Glycomyces harbinensis]SDD57780.1 chromosomal replication initiator protein [Glycomyces harbinensis]
MTDQDLSAVWSAVTAELADTSALTRQQQAWMRLTQPVLAVGGTFIIAAPDKFARSAFESKLRLPISDVLTRLMGQPTQIAVTLQEKQADPPAPEPSPPAEAAHQAPPAPAAQVSPPQAPQPPAGPAEGAPVNGAAHRPPEDPDATIVFERPGSFDRPSFEQSTVDQNAFNPDLSLEETQRLAPARKSVPSQNPPSLFDTAAFRAGEAAGAASAEPPAAPEPEPSAPERSAAIPHQPVRPADPEPPSVPRWEERQPEPPGDELERVLSEAHPRQGAKENGAGPLVAPPPSDDPDPERRGGITKPGGGAAPVKAVDGVGRLNPRYNFDTFVIGSSNRFAHAAAFAVAEAPAKAYNPLFIYGGSGLGKTHLLHAVGHYAHDLGTAHSVRYVTTEEFTNDFINSLSDRRQQAFQRRYRDVDILLIDDIQFLMDRERTQEEFFHTFNALHNANKQLVISSDRSPKQLQTLEDRLRTRFEWGLLADIQPPDLETRIAILRKKAVQDQLNVPTDAVEFIATQIHHSIRELEGALIRVTAYASLNKKPVDLGLAEEVLHDIIPENGKSAEITVDQVMGATADYFGVQSADLKGNSRSRALVNARQVAMYLCRELTDLSLPRIGQAFGGRDHTTVMHANKKIRKQMSERRALYNQIAELTNRLKHTDD